MGTVQVHSLHNCMLYTRSLFTAMVVNRCSPQIPSPFCPLSCQGRAKHDVFSLEMFEDGETVFAGPGFTLPANMGDLDPAITDLDLSECCLIGAWVTTTHLLLSTISCPHSVLLDSLANFMCRSCFAHLNRLLNKPTNRPPLLCCVDGCLVGEIPASLGRLTHLRKLNLLRNKLSGACTPHAQQEPAGLECSRAPPTEAACFVCLVRECGAQMPLGLHLVELHRRKPHVLSVLSASVVRRCLWGCIGTARAS